MVEDGGRRRAEERRRSARVFGDVLPDVGTDERGRDEEGGAAGGRAGADTARDRELAREVPPHHG